MLFISFFLRLRSAGLKVTPTQWLALVEGLAKGLHGSSLTGFYSLARSLLVKDESELDDFDVAFAAHFEGAPGAVARIEDEVMRWLSEPAPPLAADPQWLRMLDEVDVEALRAEFEKRLAEQKERHDGGSKWVGTRGTSPFGHSGYHPGGIRVGGERGLGSAVQVAAQRRYREHRRDLELDVRQLGVALRKLRALVREGVEEELDVEETVDATAREAGELALRFRPPRANGLSLILAMDVGGSMEPYRDLVDQLFSAAHAARHFRKFEHFYFHNCVYDRFYRDSWFSDPVPMQEVFGAFGRETRLVLVGDAYMYPGELFDRFGSVNYWERNEEPGLAWLERISGHFRNCAWINPMNPRMWVAPSVRAVGKVFPMYALTVEGVAELASDLV